MGIQYHAEKEDLVKAGWVLSEVQESLPVFDDFGEETGEYEEFPMLVAEKDGWRFVSYASDSLCVDCNSWGSNKDRLFAAGLFNIPHEVC